MLDIYSSRIMELASDICHTSPLIPIDSLKIGRATKVSKICGSQISVELQVSADPPNIVSYSIEPKACALGQASASILARNVIGSSIEEIKAARDGLYRMLKEGEAPPEGTFWEIRYLEPIIDYLPRHASVMLAWEATIAAIEDAIRQ